MGLRDQLGDHVGGEQHRLLDENDELLENAQKPVPSEAELANTYVAPGSKAQLPIGITYQAAWKNEADGMARHARNQVRALATTGLPIRLQSFGQRLIINEDLAESVRKVAYLEGVSFTQTALAIKQLVFSTPQRLREAICPTAVRTLHPDRVEEICGRTIIYTSWERDRVHPEYIEQLKEVGQVWLPCGANVNAFTRSGLDPEQVKLIPFPFDPEETLVAPRGPEDVPDGKRFYSIAKWEPRKNQHRLLGAFLRGFTPKDRASLMLKTSGFGLGWANYPEPEESLAHWLADEQVKANGWTSTQVDRLVCIVAEKVSVADLNRIHLDNNIYVSAGLGEAWDIPAFEARLAGNRLVYVGYGGPEGYADEEDVRVVWDEMEPVHPGYLWEPDAQWAKVSVNALSKAMQQATPPERRILPPDLYGSFSLVRVGERMSKALKEVATRHDCWMDLIVAGGFG